MHIDDDRRRFLQLAGVGGLVFASGLAGCAHGANNRGTDEEFCFLQLSDTHWGFSGPPNPEASSTLKTAIAQINASPVQLDFIVFTGDLTHTTDDPTVRRRRMAEFKQIVSGLRVKDVKFIPGEHDASLDGGAAYREAFGALHQSFDHKGVHFVALDNVSDPGASFGAEQLQWLRDDLARVAPGKPIVVFAHRPLFDLYPEWDWATRDGAQALAILQGHANVTVFYGHIHQEHHQMTGAIAHHSARSLIFPLPPPGSQPKRAPLPWDPASPDHGLGYRQTSWAPPAGLAIAEIPYQAPAAAVAVGTVVKIAARRYEFSPRSITLRQGVPAVIELASLDIAHGFNVPALGIRAQVAPGQTVRIPITPDRVGSFPVHCDVFCGEGHEGMTAEIVVAP